MLSENVPMVEKPSTPIAEEPNGPAMVNSNDPDVGAPHQGEGASPGEKPKLPRLSDPYENEPQLEGDPFGHLFKILSDKDTAQCKAWEDEVQNILIFAALFSAVVTAFIIESYQRLQPDPNDVMVNLLAHIAQRIDGVPLNGTSHVSSILSGNDFVPSQADIRINVAWFISLVLSLSAALIGIVTLQWLREHRQYPFSPKDKLGILNMRMESLQRWYVPQIFASLPLFVQGSLIFFFAGIIEFLFGLDAKVAIPVTLCICIPLTFLLVTTMFPLLQVYFLLSPFGLPFRTGVPSPCPYKSPQSIIVCRIGKILAWFVRECDIWEAVVRYYRPAAVNQLLPSSDWAAMDRKWLEARANYATLPHLPAHKVVYNFKDCLQTVDHDAVTLVFRRVMNLDLAESDTTALYHCMNAAYSTLAEDVLYLKKWAPSGPEVMDRLVSSTLSLIPRSGNTKDFIQHTFTNINNQSGSKGLVSAALLLISFNSFPLSLTSKLVPFLREMTSRILLERLALPPDALFSLEDSNSWFPDEFWDSVLLAYFPDPIILKHATSLFHNFLEKCTQPHPVTTLRPEAEKYGAARLFMQTVVPNQSIEDTNLTLVHMKTMCNTTTPQERPFLFLAACFYMDEVSSSNTEFGKGLNPALKPARDKLLDLLCLQCNVSERGFSFGEWHGLKQAVKGIYDAYTHTHEGQEPPQIEPDIPETQPEADPTIEFNPDASSEV